MEILKCEGIRKVYGTGSSQVVALDRINLSVEKGEFVAIIGASGSVSLHYCIFPAVWINRRKVNGAKRILRELMS